MSAIQIVKQKWDSPSVQNLFELLQAEYMGIYGEVDPDDTTGMDQLVHPDGDILVAFSADVESSRPVAMIAWSPHNTYTDVALMRRTYTHWRYRRLGIARDMVRACEQSAKAAGKTHLWLEHGTAQTAARALYLSLGYVPELAVPFGHYAPFHETTSIFLGKEL